MTQTPWMSHYPSFVEPELAALPAAHLPEMVRTASSQYADTIAFTQCMPNGMNGSLTFKEVDELSDQFAIYLRETVGVTAGERVALQMPNCLSYPVAAFGVLKAGCVLVNTNPLYTPSEMIHQFSDSGATVLVVIDMFADRLDAVLPQTNIHTVVTTKIGEFFPPVIAGVIRLVQKVWNRSLPAITVEHTPFRDALKAGKSAAPSAQVGSYLDGVTADSVAALQYTGGTTGVAKGAMLTQTNLIANTMQTISMAGSFLRPGKETVMTALPLYHVFAFTLNLLSFYHLGARNILIPTPRPPSNLKRAFENYTVTWLTGVNTLFQALLKERWFQDSPPASLRASAAGGMALHTSVAKQWREMVGTPIVEGYGLTESSPVLTFNPLDGTARDGTIGIPVPSTLVRCVDDEGHDVPVGQAGELFAKGPQIMAGYWNKPEETAAAITDGWLHTGDVAEMDADGFFTVVDRKKDVILVSGFNVYPNEVEDQIAAVPGVLEVGVIGLPDEKSGERVEAFVVASHPPPSSEAIRAYCRTHLAAYKVPQRVTIIDELPKSPIGKILRRQLRSTATGEIATQSGSTDEKGSAK
ncbi:long-chain acyl-CoA synthetase [Pontimonas salivibrio]|uniref:Long-chain-fatty-acid--CoA ligase n=2 Tax=Pontimonas salivibrio TaxID=1159327 RepID=A0A2L2BPU2_9MICO|nr:long-chain acyl-CoA synthetase [Pontimonas salivibrio]